MAACDLFDDDVVVVVAFVVFVNVCIFDVSNDVLWPSGTSSRYAACIVLIKIIISRAHGVVVSHPLSMREALGSIPSVSILILHKHSEENGGTHTFTLPTDYCLDPV